MSIAVQKNKIRGDFIIENFTIGELTFQKKRKTEGGAGDITIDQIPFSLGVGTGHRARGIPYVISISNPDMIFPYPITHSQVD
tara:strand:+ start:9012 stop:9260 length:249 start_codon:yes stop_codon:yes gene_type:complete